jgi:hypothetical protein
LSMLLRSFCSSSGDDALRLIEPVLTVLMHTNIYIVYVSIHCSVQVSASSHDTVKELTSMLISEKLTAATAGLMVQLWSCRTVQQLLHAMTALTQSSLLSKQDKQRVTFLRTIFANHLH